MRSSLPTIIGVIAALFTVSAHATHPELPVSSSLSQKQNGTAIPVGQVIPLDPVVITADSSSLTCNSSTPDYQLDIEIRPVAQAFTGVPTHNSALMAKPSCVQQTYPATTITLAPDTYHWQVREHAPSGVSAWVQFNAGQAAFTIAPPNVPDIRVKFVQMTTTSVTTTQLEFNVDATFENRGTVTTGNFTWKAYLSTDKLLQATDQLLFTATTPVDVPGTSTVIANSGNLILNPRPPAGQYYILVEADPAPGCSTNCGTVVEFDELNNVGSMANYFVNGVDLVAASVGNGPINTGPGQSVTLNINFYNQGIDNPLPNAAVTFRIVATRDQTVSTDDYEVYRNTYTINGPTNANIPVTFTLPQGVAGGDVYWGLQIDPDLEITNEASRANNAKVSTGTTHVQQADLSTDSADMVDVLTGQPTRIGDMGQLGRFKVRATNFGDFAAPPYKVGVILSKDTNLSLLSDHLFADADVQGLAPGVANTATLDITVTLPSVDKAGNPLVTGDYYMFVLLDSFGAINELNEANNTIGVMGPVRLRKPAPDYGVLRVQAPSAAAAGETIAISRAIKNVGTDHAPQTEYACFISLNNDIRPTDFPLSFVGTNGTTSTSRIIQLQAGENDSITEWVRLPSSLPAGAYYLGCIVDPKQTVTELSEDNNALPASTTTQVVAQSFRIVTAQLPDAVVNQPYQFKLAASGASGPVTWSVVGNPPGDLSLGQTDGTLVGVPTSLGVFSIRVTANDGKATDEAVITLRVLPPTTQLTITTDKLPPATNSTQLTYQGALSAVGGARPYVWSILSGTLPNGLSLNTDTGVISGNLRSGVPNGETKLTVQVREKLGTVVQKQVTLRTVPSGALVISTTAMPDALIGQDYISDLAANMAGGSLLVKPLEWTIVSGKLPEGLTLATHSDLATGLVTGKATTAGTFAFTVQVRDGENRVDTTDFVVRIFPSARKVTLETPAPAVIHPGEAVSLTVISTGVGGATYRLFAGALPPGVSLSADGKITGTVADEGAEGTWTFTVEAQDPAGGKGLGGFTLEVAKAPVAQGCSSTASGVSLIALLVFGLWMANRRRAVR